MKKSMEPKSQLSETPAVITLYGWFRSGLVTETEYLFLLIRHTNQHP